MHGSYGRKAYMAYIAEGLGNMLDWDEVMKFQRKNGSLFCCPSTTAGVLIRKYNDQAHQYLNSLVSEFGSAGGSILFLVKILLALRLLVNT